MEAWLEAFGGILVFKGFLYGVPRSIRIFVSFKGA